MDRRRSMQDLADWILPRRVQRLLTYYHPPALRFLMTQWSVIRQNRELRNRHAGERCFILCNGPSVKEQDIRWLKKEMVFSVSSGYLHPDFLEVAPRYHCLPQITYGKLDRDTATKWLAEMDAGIGSAELFLSHQERELVQVQKLFTGRKVHYLCLGKTHFPENAAQIPNLAGILPRVQTVPILVTMIALYMGFKKLYLIGADHDWFVKKEYKYFFEPGLLKGLDSGVREDGTLETTLWDEIPAITRVWAQYRSLKRIAQFNGASIYNATHGGMLDEFQRVCLEDLERS